MKDAPGSFKERMKKAFNECYKAVVNCEEEATGRKRCELFREIPDRRVRIISLSKVFPLSYYNPV